MVTYMIVCYHCMNKILCNKSHFYERLNIHFNCKNISFFFTSINNNKNYQSGEGDPN